MKKLKNFIFNTIYCIFQGMCYNEIMKKYGLIILSVVLVNIFTGCNSTQNSQTTQTTKTNLNAVFFEANSVEVSNQSKTVLDTVGQKMQSDPTQSIRLLNCIAPPKTNVLRDDGTPAISAARAGYVMEYLGETYGVTESRVQTEYIDITNMPKADNINNDNIYSCVVIMFGDEKK